MNSKYADVGRYKAFARRLIPRNYLISGPWRRAPGIHTKARIRSSRNTIPHQFSSSAPAITQLQGVQGVCFKLQKLFRLLGRWAVQCVGVINLYPDVLEYSPLIFSKNWRVYATHDKTYTRAVEATRLLINTQVCVNIIGSLLGADCINTKRIL